MCARRKKHEATTYSHGVQVSFVSAALRCRCIHTTRHPPPRGCLHLFRSLVSPCVDARVRHVGGVGIWKGRKGHSFSFSLSLSFFLSLFRNYLVTRLVFRFPPLSPLSLSILRVCEFSPPLPPLSRAGEREIRVLIDLRGILIL